MQTLFKPAGKRHFCCSEEPARPWQAERTHFTSLQSQIALFHQNNFPKTIPKNVSLLAALGAAGAGLLAAAATLPAHLGGDFAFPSSANIPVCFRLWESSVRPGPGEQPRHGAALPPARRGRLRHRPGWRLRRDRQLPPGPGPGPLTMVWRRREARSRHGTARLAAGRLPPRPAAGEAPAASRLPTMPRKATPPPPPPLPGRGCGGERPRGHPGGGEGPRLFAAPSVRATGECDTNVVHLLRGLECSPRKHSFPEDTPVTVALQPLRIKMKLG